jgi:hypothetical protein
MRMWMIEPSMLCNKHLLGEHGEIHKHRHNFVKQHSITGRIKPIVLIEPSAMKARHDELAKEMIKREMNHKSPYKQPSLSHLPKDERYAKADINYNLIDLANRCPDCKERINANS